MKTFTCFVIVALAGMTGLKAQTTASRLVAWAASYNFFANDSAHYTYTGTNGGDLTHTLKYDSETTYANQADTFALYSAYTQSFNGSDDILTNLYQYWTNPTMIWTPAQRNVYAYDAANHDTLATQQQWNTTNWLSQYRAHYHYAGNNVDTVTEQDSITKWVGDSRNTFTYNGADSLTNEVFQYWDLTKNKWFNNQQLTCYYNALNYDTAQIYQDYDTAAQQWTNSSKYLYYYNAGHIRTFEYFFSWEANAWDTTNKVFLYYDAANNDTADITLTYSNGKLDTLVQRNYRYNQFNQLTYYQFNGNPGFFFEPYLETKYYYEDYTTGVNQLSLNSEQLSVYPNPTTGEFTLRLTSNQNGNVVEVYNELGEIVFKSPLGDLGVKPIINLSLQPSGLYFVEVKTDKGLQVSKVMVTR